MNHDPEKRQKIASARLKMWSLAVRLETLGGDDLW
jgi:hypothetical protein